MALAGNGGVVRHGIGQQQAIAAAKPGAGAFGDAVGDIHLSDNAGEPVLSPIGEEVFDSFDYVVAEQTLASDEVQGVSVDPVCGVDVDSPAEIATPVTVLDVFQGIDYEPGPGLSDAERFDVASLLEWSTWRPTAYASVFSRFVVDLKATK